MKSPSATHRITFLDPAIRRAFSKRLGHKYQLILDILLNTGLKLSELVSLRPSDVNLDGEFLIATAKDKSTRRIPLNPSAKASLYLWMQTYAGQDRLFEIDSKAISERFRRASRGLGVRITPQSCRHTYITSIYKVTKDIGAAQRAAGHASSRSTLAYCHATDDDVKNAVGKI
jgi:integrase